MVGLRVELGALWATLGLLGWVVVAMLVSRAAVVYGLMPFVQRLPGAQPINNTYKAVIFWEGCGAIALAMVLSFATICAAGSVCRARDGCGVIHPAA